MQRLIDEGRWQRIGRGIVYLGEGSAPWSALAWAGVLQGGDHARLGGGSALFAAGVTASAPEVITVLIPHEQRLLPPGPPRLRRVRRDVWYQRYRLVVELDGRLGHEGAGRFRDMTRDNRSLLGGDHTLRYGWADVTGQPCAVAWEIGETLRRLGWTGVLDRCARCARV